MSPGSLIAPFRSVFGRARESHQWGLERVLDLNVHGEDRDLGERNEGQE